METISLKLELQEWLERDATSKATTANDMLNDLVESYRRSCEAEKLQRETVAYVRMHPDLVGQYLGRWVAIHERALVDHDAEPAALYQRIRQRFGRTSVLLREVEDQPSRELRTRSPRLAS